MFLHSTIGGELNLSPKSLNNTEKFQNFLASVQISIYRRPQLHWPWRESTPMQMYQIAWAASKRAWFLPIGPGATSETDWNRLGRLRQHRTRPLNIWQIWRKPLQPSWFLLVSPRMRLVYVRNASGENNIYFYEVNDIPCMSQIS